MTRVVLRKWCFVAKGAENDFAVIFYVQEDDEIKTVLNATGEKPANSLVYFALLFVSEGRHSIERMTRAVWTNRNTNENLVFVVLTSYVFIQFVNNFWYMIEIVNSLTISISFIKCFNYELNIYLYLFFR